MDDQVIRDLAEPEAYRVIFEGRLCSPAFNSQGAAQIYLDMLRAGAREPERGVA
jgi:hypothetical protein